MLKRQPKSQKDLGLRNNANQGLKPDFYLINNKSTFKRKQNQACLNYAERSAFNKVKTT